MRRFSCPGRRVGIHGDWRARRAQRLELRVSSLDYLNRAMPSEAEFEVSVNRIGKAGLADVAANGFALTEAGRSILRNALGPGTLVYSR